MIIEVVLSFGPDVKNYGTGCQYGQQNSNHYLSPWHFPYGCATVIPSSHDENLVKIPTYKKTHILALTSNGDLGLHYFKQSGQEPTDFLATDQT